MGLEFEQRGSDSPYVERIWRSRSAGLDRMTSVATAHWTMVFWVEAGEFHAAVQGPETRAASAPVPEDATFLGVRFALGTTMPWLPIGQLVDGFAELPDASRRSFRLNGSSWSVPDFDNVESFVRRFARTGGLVRDGVVREVLAGGAPDLSVRSVRRHFLGATGLTPGAIRQIERARRAAVLIQAGVPIADVTSDVGYFDHAHLARSLRRFIGQSATELRGEAPEQLSLLYKP
ncbi:helix-turn-helix domain-containing protein [Tenggerimyces flavus]|uniref:Helix-turn-helix domain-containing protein n=1 Tax=Tenggerimyces flavus TaxID=1708749 RepID=A0ABV7YD40_9ACTN|nr:helix-turn-helix domain-containing protein [Tenggerimyces flavus]MBM7791303.1 hypothetical protein [Tenggerimyces flavus]